MNAHDVLDLLGDVKSPDEVETIADMKSVLRALLARVRTLEANLEVTTAELETAKALLALRSDDSDAPRVVEPGVWNPFITTGTTTGTSVTPWPSPTTTTSAPSTGGNYPSWWIKYTSNPTPSTSSIPITSVSGYACVT